MEVSLQSESGTAGQDPRYDVLFEPVRIEPVTSKNRFYSGAELLATAGARVTLVTPANLVSEWTLNTLEQHRIQGHATRLGVHIVTPHGLAAIRPGEAELPCVFTRERRGVPCEAVVLVTTIQGAWMREASSDRLIRSADPVGKVSAPSQNVATFA